MHGTVADGIAFQPTGILHPVYRTTYTLPSAIPCLLLLRSTFFGPLQFARPVCRYSERLPALSELPRPTPTVRSTHFTETPSYYPKSLFCLPHTYKAHLRSTVYRCVVRLCTDYCSQENTTKQDRTSSRSRHAILQKQAR
jgi:hypothetical protein